MGRSCLPGAVVLVGLRAGDPWPPGPLMGGDGQLSSLRDAWTVWPCVTLVDHKLDTKVSRKQLSGPVFSKLCFPRRMKSGRRKARSTSQLALRIRKEGKVERRRERKRERRKEGRKKGREGGGKKVGNRETK